MLRISRLRELMLEVKEAIDGVKYVQVIISNDDFAEFLKARTPEDNTMVFAVLPEHGLTGREDSVKMDNYLQFFFINKSVTRNLDHDQKLDVFDGVQGIVEEFVKYILEQKSDEDNQFCDIFSEFSEETMDIKTYWDGFECRGYEVSFQLKSKV